MDIDKRYLVRLSYNITYGKKRDGVIEEDIVSTSFDKDENPEDYYRNELINNYLVLLKSHGILTDHGLDWADSSHTSLSSIDKDTGLVTGVRDKINRNKPKKRYYAFLFGNIAFLVITKMKFMIGKFGIGPFALNNNNQILTQLYNVMFAKSLEYTNILDALGCLSLAKETDKQGNRILSWLSGLINVHVDIAKNPDSIDGLNINTFTYNLVNLLIRTGMGERALFFTGQPVMTELSRVYDDASGSFMTDPNKSKTAKQNAAIKDFLYDNYGSRGKQRKKELCQRVDKFMLDERSNTEEEQKMYEESLGSFAKALFGIDDNGNYVQGFTYITQDGRIINKGPVEVTDPKTGEKHMEGPGCILEDILTNDEILRDVRKGATFDNLDDREAYVIFVKDENGNDVELRLSARQVQEYVAYIQNNLNIYARHLSDLVNACKIDTKKHGKNYVEQQAYLDKYNAVFDKDQTVFESKGLLDLKILSYIDTKTTNAISLYEQILKLFSIQATDSFKKIHNAVITRLNSSVQNKQLSSKITRAIMTHIKMEFFNAYTAQRGEDYYLNLFYGDNTIQYRLLHLQNAIRSDKTGKYRTYGTAGIITNPLLKALVADVYEKRVGFDDPKLITMENSLLDDSDSANAIERAWDDMFNDKEHYTEDEQGNRTYYMREFAIDLAVYAFLTSGDQNGTGKFFKFVPNTIRKHLSAEFNGVPMTYNEFMRQKRLDYQTELSEEEADAIAREVIFENWYDNEFVRSVRMTKGRGQNRKTMLTAKMTYNDESTSNVRVYSPKNKNYYFIAKTITKKIVQVLAGARKKEKTLIPTIYKVGDNYPAYIKVRRQSAYKKDNDNLLLYEYCGDNFIDENKPEEGTYPVYRLVLPSSCRFRAGSYQHTIYGISNNGRSPVYPVSSINAIEIMQHQSSISESNDKQSILESIKKAFNKMAIWMDDPSLEDFILTEYQMNNVEDTSTLPADVKALKKAIGIKDEKESGKEKKKEQLQTEPDGSYDIWYGSSEKERKNGVLSNLAPRKVKYNGITYPSVESAFLAQKLGYADMSKEDKKDVLKALKVSTGGMARSIGNNNIKKLDKSKWDKDKYKLMYEIMKASFEQNKTARDLLLSTGDATLTHLKASLRDEWRTKFPEILTDVRTELAKKYKDKLENSKEDDTNTTKPSAENNESETPKSKEKKTPDVIDISSDEYKIFSNMANRNVRMGNLEFPTVMHALNYAIVSAVDIDEETKDKYKNAILSAKDMREIQSAVREAVTIAGKKPFTPEQLGQLMYKVMYESFKLNPEIAAQLMDTGDVDIKAPSEAVAKSLMKIRSKLLDEEIERAKQDEDEYSPDAEEHCTGK